MSVNKAILIGFAGADPEVRYIGESGNGTKVATLRLATSEKYKDRDGNIKEQTEWHNVVVWRSLADIVEKYVKKGTQIYVEGKLSTRQWEDNAGVKRYQTDIVANTLQLLGRKDSSDNRAPHPADSPGSYIQSARQMAAQSPQNNQPGAPLPGYAQQQPAPAPTPQQGSLDIPDDDLPF